MTCHVIPKCPTILGFMGYTWKYLASLEAHSLLSLSHQEIPTIHERVWLWSLNVDGMKVRVQKAERRLNIERFPRSMGTSASSRDKAWLERFSSIQLSGVWTGQNTNDVLVSQRLSDSVGIKAPACKSTPGHPAVPSPPPFPNCDIILLECMHAYKTLIRTCLKRRPAGAHYDPHGKLSRSDAVQRPTKHDT